MKSRIFIILIICMFHSCIERFDPPSSGSQNLLVVEALLTNEDHPFEVRLARTMQLDTTVWAPEQGAQVSISIGSGEEYELWEFSGGRYRSPDNINTKVGESYQLHIRTSNGNRYASDQVIMRNTPPIDSISWKYEEIPSRDLQGVQFYVTTHDPENNTWYYRWEWVETWSFYTPYYSVIYWEDQQVKPREENINKCWKTGKSTAIQIATSRILDKDLIYQYPLYYADNTRDRFNSKYSLNVKQYSLSEESYYYWKELKAATENLGSLFDPQPTSLHGNIHNINNDREIVIGYFDAATVQERRAFISSLEIPRMKFPDDFKTCEEVLVPYSKINGKWLEGLWLIYSTKIQGAILYAMSTPECIDCRLYGTNVEPDYWY